MNTHTIPTKTNLVQRARATVADLYRRTQLLLIDTEILSAMSRLDGLRELRADLPAEIEDAKLQLHALLDERRALSR